MACFRNCWRKFGVDELIEHYVALSYTRDCRVEKPGKAQTIVSQAPDAYREMVFPILEDFSRAEIIQPTAEELVWEKSMAPTSGELLRATVSHKARSAGRNLIKNAITGGVLDGAKYALAKVKRARG